MFYSSSLDSTFCCAVSQVTELECGALTVECIESRKSNLVTKEKVSGKGTVQSPRFACIPERRKDDV